MVPAGRCGVYDVRGRVAAVVGPFASAGEARSVVWDGLTPSGRAAATGVYFARVESAAGMSESRRIVVVR